MPTRDAALNTTRLVRLPSLFDSRGGRFVDGQWRPIAGYQWGGTAGADRQGEFPRRPNIPAPPEPQAAGLPVARALPVAGQGPRSVAGQRPPARVSGAAPASTPGTGLAAHPAAPPARTPQAEPPPLTQRPPAALSTRPEPEYSATPMADEGVYQYLRENGREDLAADVGTAWQRITANTQDGYKWLLALDRAVSDADIPLIEALAGAGRLMTEVGEDVGQFGFNQTGDFASGVLNLSDAIMQTVTPGGDPAGSLRRAGEDFGRLGRRTASAATAAGELAFEAADPRTGGTAGMAVRALNDAGGFAPVSATGEAPRPTPASRDGLSFGGGRGQAAQGQDLDLTGARRVARDAAPAATGGIPMPDSTRTAGHPAAGGMIPASARSSSAGSGGRGTPSNSTATASGRGSRTAQPSRTGAEDLNAAMQNMQSAPETALRQLARMSNAQGAAARRELYRRRDPISGGEPTRGQRGLY